MKRKEYPEEGEFVIGTVINVQNYGAFVSLDEYPNKEGFIHIAEIASGWVKRIRNHIKEKQKVVCKVLHVDESKGHIDLSLKRVNEHQKREKIKEWKNTQKAEKLMEMLANKLGKTVEQCYNEFGDKLIDKFGSLYAAFEETAYDPDILKQEGFTGDWIEEFQRIAQENITIPFVEITGYIDISSNLPDGVNHIKQALLKGEESEYEDVNIEIHYVGGGQYSIIIKAPDYKIAEEEMKKAVARIEEDIKGKGTVDFHRKMEE
ncbi:MAG: translation initiation factor IF-2 subunit alpha [Thermoplasmata archaeon]|nr:MAG: translation initiation factor IF-2 subunit alpha [Thermoplasmata archaeon]HEC89963.1 translation initiation factor IF-2 subunit alpha [Thermoplasmatales archaeon]